MEFQPLTKEYDAELAALIRANLKKVHLDIPGTAYYDESLDHLSEFYHHPRRAYFVLLDGTDLAGGVGLAETDLFPGCCELQKLYLDDRWKGRGLGYRLMEQAEGEALRLGYQGIYLETHSKLKTAIHLYEKTGFREIRRPQKVVHSTMDRFFLKELTSCECAKNGDGSCSCPSC